MTTRLLWSQLRAVMAVLVCGLLFSACTLPWQKTVAGLQVQITDGSAAQVYLDDLHLGQTPIQNQDLKPGVYKLRIEPPQGAGKQAYETQIRLYSGSISSVLWSFVGGEPTGTGDILELEPLPTQSRAELGVITIPEGAGVLLNTTTYGLSPVVLDEIEPGDYSLTLNAVGHVKKTLPVKVQKGFRLHIFSRLEKDTAALDTSNTAPLDADTTASSSATLPATASATIMATPVPATKSATTRATPVASATPIAATGSATRLTPPYVTIRTTETGWLRVRSEASSAGTEVAKVNSGTSYPYKSTLNGWYEIEYASGKLGWISGQFADIMR